MNTVVVRVLILFTSVLLSTIAYANDTMLRREDLPKLVDCTAKENARTKCANQYKKKKALSRKLERCENRCSKKFQDTLSRKEADKDTQTALYGQCKDKCRRYSEGHVCARQQMALERCRSKARSAQEALEEAKLLAQKACAASAACIKIGHCVFDSKAWKCVQPRNTSECQKTAKCQDSGMCKHRDGRCTPGSIENCLLTRACKRENKGCSYATGGCVDFSVEKLKPRRLIDEILDLHSRRYSSQLTDAAIGTLKRLIKVSDDDDPEKAEYLNRLAAHYSSKALRYRIQIDKLNAEHSHLDNQVCAKEANLELEERKWAVEAGMQYQKILKQSGNAASKRRDEVLYNLVNTMYVAWIPNKAEEYFKEIRKKHQKSGFIPQAYISAAEYHFRIGEIRKAITLAQKVNQFSTSPVYGYSLFLQGWCWLKLNEPRRALEMFTRVVKDCGDSLGLGRPLPEGCARWTGSDAAKRLLIEETLRLIRQGTQSSKNSR